MNQSIKITTTMTLQQLRLLKICKSYAIALNIKLFMSQRPNYTLTMTTLTNFNEYVSIVSNSYRKGLKIASVNDLDTQLTNFESRLNDLQNQQQLQIQSTYSVINFIHATLLLIKNEMLFNLEV